MYKLLYYSNLYEILRHNFEYCTQEFCLLGHVLRSQWERLLAYLPGDFRPSHFQGIWFRCAYAGLTVVSVNGRNLLKKRKFCGLG